MLSGVRDELKVRALGSLLVDDFLSVVEAASALHFATVASVSRLRCRGAASGLTDLAFADAVADAHDHGDGIYR
jgi:hypothetical protein